MSSNNSDITGSPRAEQGAALIALVFILGLVFTAYVLASYRPLNINAERSKQTAQALVEAKAALIGWAVRNTDVPGRLPCPEDTTKIGTENEGQAAGNCTLPAIGRLPFKTLGIGDLRDGNKDRLWYAISEGFRANPPTSFINSETPAQLTVDGVANSAVAIVFSPGTPLSGQERNIPTAASPPSPADYLESTNTDGDNSFISKNNSSDFNDRLLLLSHQDLFWPVEKKVLREAKKCLDTYAASSGGKYPWAAPVTAPAPYVGAPNTTFGRIPNLINVQIIPISVPLPTPIGNDPDMGTAWSAGCIFNEPYWNSDSGWRKLVFYQLASGYSPQLLGTAACGSPNTCLSITGSGHNNTGSGSYRAIVLMARQALATQGRANQGVAANYLEGNNVHTAMSPSLEFETYRIRDPQSLLVNDLALCIDGNNYCR